MVVSAFSAKVSMINPETGIVFIYRLSSAAIESSIICCIYNTYNIICCERGPILMTLNKRLLSGAEHTGKWQHTTL